MFIVHSLDKVGGAETILVRLANYFSSTPSYQVGITLLTNLDIAFDLDEKIMIEQSMYNNMYQQIIGIRRVIKKNQPDIIISFITGTNIISTISSQLTKTPIIISERSSYDYGVKNRLWSFLRFITYPLADTLVLPTSTEQYKYYYVKKINIIPNPLKVMPFSVEKEREKIILAVGTLHFVKGFDMLIEAFYRANLSNWKLIILGEGKLRAKLEKQISNLNLQSFVIMPGHIKDTASYYKKSSIFVLSSRSEGYPNVLCEAMSYGCASISFDCDTGPSDIIEHEYNGLLIEPQNITKLTQSIEYLTQNKKNRMELSKNAKEIVKILNLETIGKKWEKTILETLKKEKNNG